MFYDNMRALGVRLLAKYGHALTRVRVGTQPPVGGEQWDDPIEIRDEHVFNGFARGVDAKMVNGTSVLTSDLLLICDYRALIDIADIIELPDGERQVVSRVPVPASGDLTIQKFILR